MSVTAAEWVRPSNPLDIICRAQNSQGIYDEFQMHGSKSPLKSARNGKTTGHVCQERRKKSQAGT